MSALWDRLEVEGVERARPQLPIFDGRHPVVLAPGQKDRTPYLRKDVLERVLPACLEGAHGVGEVVPLREHVGGPLDHVLSRASGIVEQVLHEPQDKLPRYLPGGPDPQVDLRFETRCAAHHQRVHPLRVMTGKVQRHEPTQGVAAQRAALHGVLVQHGAQGGAQIFDSA